MMDTDPPLPAIDAVEFHGVELAVLVEGDGVLVTGDRTAVDTWVTALRGVATEVVKATDLSVSKVADLAAVGATVGSVASLSGSYVRLSPDSVNLLRAGKLVPGTDGFFRMFTQNGNGQIAGQLQWQDVTLGPQAVVAIQTAAATAALRVAIASVERAVERVEGKVESVLALASAERTGDILGHHYSLQHASELLERSGRLPAADWDSLAALGPILTAAVERLRSHARLIVEGLRPELPAQDRADKLNSAVRDNRLGETLQLLLVAEDSLYLWQTLRIERVSATEPENISAVTESARQQLREHGQRDGELVAMVVESLKSYATIRPLELHRVFSARGLRRDVASLNADLESFAGARHLQVVSWQEQPAPTLREAADELRARALESRRAVRALGSKAVDGGFTGLDIVGSRMQAVAQRHVRVKDDSDDTPSAQS